MNSEDHSPVASPVLRIASPFREPTRSHSPRFERTGDEAFSQVFVAACNMKNLAVSSIPGLNGIFQNSHA